ncbi:hypothetical protein QBC47DRAFT_58418 [Echria macrotheca]|uniref:Uncharacterized protein n=1 Tax=Echria macrotheca TaxID=438768 RepID=A0AAJ0F3N6_9PEZI|nr:hypothetical protein QBC47DRAFT_58418 [Echria macrotheca]
MRGDAEDGHKLLLDLLDLKQKAGALVEARSTRQQGRVIVLFTIITIIFVGASQTPSHRTCTANMVGKLPLSFFTSYFGQNISEMTGDSKNPKAGELWKIGAPISVVVILIALSVAYCIMRPLHLLKRLKMRFDPGIWRLASRLGVDPPPIRVRPVEQRPLGPRLVKLMGRLPGIGLVRRAWVGCFNHGKPEPGLAGPSTAV